MADNVTVDNGGGTDYTVATNELTGGEHAQVVQIIASDAATADDRVPASETDGLLVNLGSNNDVTVTGSVTANAGTNLNTSALSTSAKQDTIIGHVDGIETLLGTIDADTSTLAGAVAGTEMQVDIVSGSVTANAGTNLNTSALALESGGNLAAAATSLATLDNIVSGSEAQVDVVAALPAGDNNIGNVDVETFPTTVHSADFDSGAGTDTTLAFGIAVPASGGAAVVPGSSTAGLKVDLGADNDVTVTGTVTVDGSGVTQPVSHAALTELAAAIDTELQVDVVGALPAGTNNIGDVDVLTLPALPAGTNNIGDVDIVSLPNEGQQTMANSISVAVASDQATFPVTAAGAAAHASPTSGNPVYVAGRASTAVPTDVGADGDAAGIWLQRNGAPVVTMAPHVGLVGLPWTLTGETAQYTSTQTSAVLVAGGASERLVVTKVQIQVGGTTAGTLQLYFGTGAYSRGTNLAIFDGEFAPSATLKPGVVMDGPFISATNGDDLLVTTSAAINPLTITVWYYVVT